jgi:hypothetical protein
MKLKRRQAKRLSSLRVALALLPLALLALVAAYHSRHCKPGGHLQSAPAQGRGMAAAAAGAVGGQPVPPPLAPEDVPPDCMRVERVCVDQQMVSLVLVLVYGYTCKGRAARGLFPQRPPAQRYLPVGLASLLSSFDFQPQDSLLCKPLYRYTGCTHSQHKLPLQASLWIQGLHSHPARYAAAGRHDGPAVQRAVPASGTAAPVDPGGLLQLPLEPGLQPRHMGEWP